MTKPIQAVASEHPSWWRMPEMWMVIGGPLVVVVAGVATLVVAARGADRPLLERTTQAKADSPAVQARNHAATPQR
ncbi:MAG TPA: nitrogen fixation protein FixH [Rubrivivax sp.]|jgi:hypothetical protein|nr:nitrogen fixation protein FixH [Rubrivivax sp.]